MTTDDPFASLDDERTFIMPSPGRRAAPIAAAVVERGGAEPAPLEQLMPARGLNPLVAAASPLLNIVPQLRSATPLGDIAQLRERLAQALRAFEAKAARDGAAPQQVLAARYVLCTFLDEVAAATPWGGGGAWSGHSLLVAFHNEAWGGEKLFQLLARLAEQPRDNLDLLELIWVVLALGFEGRYRVAPGGRDQLEQLRERLFALIRQQRGEPERALSPHWQGAPRKRALLLQLPLWSLASLGVLLAVALYLGLSLRLNRHSDPVFAAIQSLRAAQPAQPLQPPSPAAQPRLAALLASDVQAGRVRVADFGDRSIVTLRGDGLFEPGSATLSPAVLPLLARIGEALRTLPGKVLVSGHTDAQPIASARFPSNWHLSKQRADSVGELLAASIAPARISAEGRADSQPIAGNASAAERAQNRRVEITLFAGTGAPATASATTAAATAATAAATIPATAAATPPRRGNRP